MVKRYKRLFFAILFLQIFILGIFVFTRLLDSDEGIYLRAANLVGQGLTPYVDFFYMQMPYLPYVYAPISGFGFESLFFGRLISGVLSVLLGLILFFYVLKISKDGRLALISLFLFAFNGLTLSWHSTVKTSVFSDFFGFLSLVLFLFFFNQNREKRQTYLLFLAGVAVGLAANVRLTHAIFLFVECVWLLWLQDTILKRKLIYLGCLLCGCTIASLGSLYFLFVAPSTFIFDNLIFRQVWGWNVVRMDWMTKLFTLLKFVFYPQNMLILVLFGASLFLTFKTSSTCKDLRIHNTTLISGSFALALMLLYLSITPTQLQYFGQILPYLILGSTPALIYLVEKLNKKKIIIALAAVYMIFIVPFVYTFLFAARGKDKPHQLGHIQSVVKIVKAHTSPDDVILSPSPYLPVFAQRRAPLGLEVWGLEVLPYLNQKQISRSKLMISKDLLDVIAEKKVDLVVMEEDDFEPANNLLQENYHLVENVRTTQIFVKKSKRYSGSENHK